MKDKNNNRKNIYIILGPSGSGKTTIGDYLIELGLSKIVTNTTRQPREGEIDGIDYNFSTISEFEELDKIEYTHYRGNYYGMSKKEISNKLSMNDNIFAVMDIVGVHKMREIYPNEVKVIFITIPLEEMTVRMKNRGSDDKTIDGRIEKAIKSKEHSNGKYADYIIENINLEETKKAIDEIINNNK